MTPEEEFVAKLAFRIVTLSDLQHAATSYDSFVDFHTANDSYYYAKEDLFIVDLDVVLHAGVEFKFGYDDDSDGPAYCIELKKS